MFYHLPPVGNKIQLCTRQSRLPENMDYFYKDLRLYGSGTMALAAALLAVKKYRNILQPEVILPAYTCPDLISAIRYIGARPVLIDFEKNRPWVDLDLLTDRINKNTLAVIIVHLYGIPERSKQIKTILEHKGIALIEDSAQLFLLDNKQHQYQGDLVIYSFGRGKPVSILSGGAVLCKNKKYSSFLPGSGGARNRQNSINSYRLKTLLYNIVISPYCYWLPASLPFLELGETKFKPLAQIEEFDTNLKLILQCNIENYLKGENNIQNRFKNMLTQIKNDNKFIDLYAVCGSNTRLLRYPVLFSSASRKENLFKLLGSMGASKSYPTTLPYVGGLELLKEQGQFPSAEAFAQNIITLPVHSGVRESDVLTIQHIVQKELYA